MTKENCNFIANKLTKKESSTTRNINRYINLKLNKNDTESLLLAIY